MLCFTVPVGILIRARLSCRTYERRDLGDAARAELQTACRALDTGFDGERVRLLLVERNPETTGAVKLGDYGIICNPCCFLVGAVRESAQARVSYGYLLEQLVLKAAELELGTCWLGIFNPVFFPEVSPANGEITPAVCVVGLPAKRRSLTEAVVRLAAGSDRRKSWPELFFLGSPATPLSREAAGVYGEPLELLRLAPSAGNSQPWRVVRRPDRFDFFLKPTNPLYRRMNEVDIGIALCHFELGARAQNLTGTWQRLSPAATGMVYVMSWVTH